MMDCSHLDNVKVDTAITKNISCSECGVKDQNWVCLQCGVVNCGRYVSGHAKLHAESHDHQICMSCDIYSVYCYKCDDFISNDNEEGSIDKIRKSIMKAWETDNGESGINLCESIDESSKECLNVSMSSEENITFNAVDKPSSPVSTLDERGTADLNSDSNLSDTPSTPTSSITEVSENKPSNSTKNSEEPIRTLRPRSRKRSHSEDSSRSSTENNSTTSRSKEKKLSPCNGKRDKKVVGLKNLGNTCFMNAVLQSLNNIQEFSCYFNQLPALEMKTNGRKVYHSRSITRQDMQDVVMAEELRKVLINLNTGCGKTAISPECLFHVIWKVVPRFRGYQQQDAHEFLRYMLDRLHTELLQLVPERAAAASASASIVTAVFGGTLQSEVRCLACGAESKKFDPFLDLSLELPEASRHEPVSLADCLTSFVQVEELADTERYFCNSCKSKQESTKQFWIRRLPNVLCLHLKRFRWHNYFRTKVDTAISFPLHSLDMSRFLPAAPPTRRAKQPAGYDLAAVIVHHGSGAGSGHYTAFAVNDGQWFHFNDQTVRPAAASAVASCKPYILFYIRSSY